jgi:peptidoglycan/LPS O-acetylase OafA/YrhL
MNSARQQNDTIFLLGGIALLVSGLIFLGASFNIFSLRSNFSQGILALMTGLGFLAGTRFQPKLRWAWIPAAFFLVWAAILLLHALQPGTRYQPGAFIWGLVLWGVAIGLLIAFRPSKTRWWPIIVAGVLCFTGLEVVLHHLWPGAGTDGPMVLFYGLALSFFAVHLINRQRIWPLFVAGPLGLLALGLTAEEFFPNSNVGPPVFIFVLGLIFLFIHFRRRRIWWPVIPGGMLCTMAVVIHLDEVMNVGEPLAPCLIFLGLAAVFGYLYLISNDVNKLRWARYPAVALAGIAIFILVVEGGGGLFQRILLPLGLLAAGAVYIFRALRARGRE